VFELLLDVTERSLNLREAELPWKELSQHEPETFYHWAITSDRIGAHTDTDQTVPYGTALWGWHCPRHFMPGYGRTVPPGHLATGAS
jgi:hypothetical protein